MKPIKFLKSTIAFLLIFISTINTTQLFAQITTGTVLDAETKKPISYANVYWLGSTEATQTDIDGVFQLSKSNDTNQIIISSVGYAMQAFKVQIDKKYYLKPMVHLNTVNITHRRTGSIIKGLDPIKTQVIGHGDLLKSACCNLSEAFETNASVDVMIGDALSGTKQLRMMGVDGIYTSILRESHPLIYNQNIPFGLDIIPGTWLKSIALNSGISSSIHGHESMSGSINVEFENPEKGDLLYVNVFANSFGRVEANVHSALQLRNDWSTGIYLHANNTSTSNDANKDNFYDQPKRKGYALMNRWHHKAEEGKTDFSWAAFFDDKIGGQIQNVTNENYLANNSNRRLESSLSHSWGKHEKPYSSWLISANAFYHTLSSVYGFKRYDGKEMNFSTQIMHQTIISDTRHKLKYGLTYTYDYTKNKLWYSDAKSYIAQGATQVEPGAALEYTYTPNDTWTLLLSQRADYNQNFGWQFSPRLFLKNRYNSFSTIRINAGRGYRIAQPFTDNYTWMANNKVWRITPLTTPEIAWNYGANHTSDFLIKEREGHLSFDLYHTQFVKQSQVDFTQADTIHITNIQGKSNATAMQVEAQWFATKHIEVKLAYRKNIVKTTYIGSTKTEEKYMTPRSKTLANIAYTSNFDKWKINATVIRNGKQRMPDNTYSPVYYNVLAQVNRNFKSGSVYAGVENALNFVQANPIFDAENPYSSSFNASEVWGPILGRVFYLGIRLSIK